MWYRVALLCDMERGDEWFWLSYPISDPIEAQIVVEYCKHLYSPGLIGYAEAETIEGLEIWLKERNTEDFEKNTPTKRSSLPEETGQGGDRDVPYLFSLPKSWQEQKAWLQLASKYKSRRLER